MTEEITPQDREELLRKSAETRGDVPEPTTEAEKAAEAMREAEQVKKPLALVPAKQTLQVELVNELRRLLDPRVILQAKDMNVPPGELTKMQERMNKWAAAVSENVPDESLTQRDLRLEDIFHEIYGNETATEEGRCPCGGLGMVSTKGDWKRRMDRKVLHRVKYYRLCGCDAGEGKRQTINAPRRRRGQGNKNDSLDTVF